MVGVLVVIVIVWLLVSAIWLRPEKDQGSEAVFVVRRGPLRISVTESGTLKSRDRVVVKSEVEGRTTILWIIAEATDVKKDDLLVELDASRLEDQKTKQEITVLNAEASFIRARENAEVMKSQSESDIAEAKLAYKFAKLDRKKYLDVPDDPDQEAKGEYPQKVKQLKTDITIAEQEKTQAQDRRDWSRKLAKKEYITPSELKSDELDFTQRKLRLEVLKGELELLQNYTHIRDLEQLKSDVEQAEKALERVKLRTSADLVQADAEFKAKQSEWTRQKTILKKTDDQIAKCRIVAPVAGMVVYSTTGRGSWRGNAEPLEEGQEVRERQELIYLPTTASMMAEVKIHESSLRKVHQGMAVVITTDALPGKVLPGKVGKIALLPDATMAWLNPDLKVFSTEIYLDGDASEIRPGMSCQAEIIVEEYADTVYVPVQSVLRVGGKPTVYVVGATGLQQPREVELGLDNNRMVRIVSGLQEGERILLAPPLAPSEVRTEVPEIKQPGQKQEGQGTDSAGKQPGAVGTGQTEPRGGRSPESGASGKPSPEEIRKRMESLSPGQREELQKRARQQRRSSQGEADKPPSEKQ